MVNTKHFTEERKSREHLVTTIINDTNKVICVNVIDRGHRNGPERFELTDKGIIKIYNNITNRHITDLIARPAQIYNRLGDAFLRLPIEDRRKVLEIARKHERLGYNNV